MNFLARRALVLIISIVIVAAGTGLAFATGGGGKGGNAAVTQYKKKCNSGRGNGSEIVNGTDCDPGNSGGHNKGGD